MKKLNMRVLNERYKNLIPVNNLDVFANNINNIKKRLDLDLINTLKPVLIYTRNALNELMYLMSVNYSLQKTRVLNHIVVSGQTLTRQNFADGDKDRELHEDTYYEEVLYITLSQTDSLSEYMENILIDLIDFRQRNRKQTVIIYDVMQGVKPTTQTKRLEDFMKSRQYIIQDTISVVTTHSATNQNTTATSRNISRKGPII